MKFSKSLPELQFQIEGKFLGFIPKPGGKLKYIHVQVEERIIPLKLAKELQETLGRELNEGDRIRVTVSQTKKGYKLKLKAEQVIRLNGSAATFGISSLSQPSSLSKPGKILLCHKSSCSKRGGIQLYRALTQALEHLGLQERVSIQLTGCQKRCKQAPSIVLMPGRVTHSYVNPNNIVALLKQHYLSPRN